VLTATLPLLAPAGAGIGSLALGSAAVPMLGFLGLAAAAAFVALVAFLSEAPEGVPEGAPEGDGPDTLGALGRRKAALCAATFLAIGVLAGSLAWEVWHTLGGVQALGLVALALTFGTAALAAAAAALRR
jgi:hypothetical protein